MRPQRHPLQQPLLRLFHLQLPLLILPLQPPPAERGSHRAPNPGWISYLGAAGSRLRNRISRGQMSVLIGAEIRLQPPRCARMIGAGAR